ncbi:MAG: hypothetical protein FD170_3303 [Bacteroidetes bacterium]|nr:MAG: hypothetical protein FD170_3303 [Bacteroidota bacterium]
MVYIFFQEPWYAAFILLPLLVLILPIYFRTYYRLHPIDGLTVICGLFYRKTFDLKQLKSIKYTSNPLSSPALSLRRLELKFENFETIMISPESREDFIAEIHKYKPEVEVKK